MLTNDTWFMYSDGFLNAGGKTPQQIDAEKKEAMAAKIKQEEEDKADPAGAYLRRITKECNDVKPTKYCSGIGRGTILCTGRIKGCINTKMKQMKVASENSIDKESDKLQAELMKKITSDEDSVAQQAGGLGDFGSDNTTLYIVGGIGAVAIIGLVGYLIIKKRQPVTA